MKSLRIILTTFGSLGDLHPYLAIAQGLKERGHRPLLATSGVHRAKVEAAGIDFAPVRPDEPEAAADPEFYNKVMNLRDGPRYVICEHMMPCLRQSFEDLLRIAPGADLLVSHPLTFMTPLVADKLSIPWASTVLAPMSFFSVHDPPMLAPMLWLAKLRFLGPRFYRPLFNLMRRSLNGWSDSWHDLRTELGLLPGADPLFAGQHSPNLVLALFSKVLGTPQPDWPTQVCATGFPFYDEDHQGLPPDLGQFLAADPAPIVFTLGSAAVMTAGTFYAESQRAAQLLGRRAVLLVGTDPRNAPQVASDDLFVTSYAPYAALFPRAAAIVHQGGVGTTAQALRSGRPMLVMPYAFDQPDNADRVSRLGVARWIPRRKYSAARAARELETLLGDPRYEHRATEVSREIRSEDGVRAACDALEDLAGAH